MKFLSFLLAVVFSLSLSVTAFADVSLEEVEPISPNDESYVEVLEESGEASSGNDYLDMLLNNMQNDITNLENEVAILGEEVSSLSETLEESGTTLTESIIEEEVNPELFDDTEMLLTSVSTYSLNPITSSGSNGLKSVLLSLIGDYDAVIVEYQYQNSSTSNYSYLREIQPDYVWLCSAAIFLVIIYSVFRLGGALFRG